MKKLFAVLAIVAISGSFAKAEDKGTEFKFGGQLRERFYWDSNPTFLNSNADTESSFVQRNQFHVNAISGDRIQAYFNVLHTSVWGATGAVPQNPSPYIANGSSGAGVPNTAIPAPASVANALAANALQIQEAWLWWKASDMLSLRAGRMTANYGDGFIMSKNDWLNNPYNFEGVMARLSWDFLDLDFGGAKLADGGLPTPSTVTTATTTNTDSEVIVYALNASLKNLPDFLKAADLIVAQLAGDQGTGGTSPTGIAFAPNFLATSGSYGLTTIALHLKGDVTMFDYRVEYAYQTGKQKASTTAGGTDVTFTGSMLDAEAGVNFPEFMKGRVSAAYHVDTGNDTGQGTSTASDPTQNHAYQPMFYDLHSYAGFMNFFGFSNLTDIRLKLSVSPEEMSDYGLLVNIASRTTANAPATILNGAGGGMFTGLPAGNDKSLGTEFDLWANHNYGHGLSTYVQVGMLSLGNYFKPVASSIGTGVQAAAQLAYNF